MTRWIWCDERATALGTRQRNSLGNGEGETQVWKLLRMFAFRIVKILFVFAIYAVDGKEMYKLPHLHVLQHCCIYITFTLQLTKGQRRNAYSMNMYITRYTHKDILIDHA